MKFRVQCGKSPSEQRKLEYVVVRSDDNGKKFFSTPVSDPDLITVHSVLKVWYYRRLKGYTVVRQTASPSQGIFGIAYRRSWTLRRNGDS